MAGAATVAEAMVAEVTEAVAAFMGVAVFMGVVSAVAMLVDLAAAFAPEGSGVDFAALRWRCRVRLVRPAGCADSVRPPGLG
jgi:hypothetical protein